MKIVRKRYIAVRDNRTKVLIDNKNIGWRKNGRLLSIQEQIDKCWRPFEEIGQAKILSWFTKNKAQAALMGSFFTKNINYEIIEMTETLEFERSKDNEERP